MYIITATVAGVFDNLISLEKHIDNQQKYMEYQYMTNHICLHENYTPIAVSLIPVLDNADLQSLRGY